MTAPSVSAAARCAPVRLRIADDWLVASSPAGARVRCWPMLLINGAMSGSARLVRGRCGSAEIRADVFVGEDRVAAPGAETPGLATARLDALYEDLAAAALTVPSLDEPQLPQEVHPAAGDVTLLKALCEEAGWTATAAASGDVLVSLDTSSGGEAASLTLDAHGHLRAVVVLVQTAVPEPSREAVGRLLLSAGAHVRSAKGCLVAGAGTLLPAIGIACERSPVTAASLDRALGALAVARQAVGREVQALYDPHLARTFLSLEETPCLHTP